MEYLLISFLAGILTVLAPCVFTLLPVILGGSLTGQSWKKPLVIIGSLSVSIFVFSLALKASTLLIDIPAEFWRYVSGGILIVFGMLTIFPEIWGWINVKLKLSDQSDKLLHKGAAKSSLVGDILVGAALGPVFSSCSPTYAVIIATILPQDPIVGVINLIAYTLGLALILALISIFGQRLIKRAKWAVNPDGIFKKVLGIVFLVVGLAIFIGLDKRFETFLLDQGLFVATPIELGLLEN